MTDRDAIGEIEPGDKIGYHPVGDDDVRVVGIVDRVRDRFGDVVVTMPDDPWIEEKVPFDRIEAHDGGDV